MPAVMPITPSSGAFWGQDRPDLPVHRLEDPPLVSTLTDADRDAALVVRGELDLGEAPVALYTGNFEAYQGVEMMAEAAAHVSQAVFVFVGAIPNSQTCWPAHSLAIGNRLAGKRKSRLR